VPRCSSLRRACLLNIHAGIRLDRATGEHNNSYTKLDQPHNYSVYAGSGDYQPMYGYSCGLWGAARVHSYAGWWGLDGADTGLTGARPCVNVKRVI